MVTRNRLGPQALGGPAMVPYDNDDHTPQPNDQRVPAAPTGLHVNTLNVGVHLNPGGGYSAYVELLWTNPGKDVDGDPMVVEVIELWGLRAGANQKWALQFMVTGSDSSVILDGYTPNVTWQFKLRAKSGGGKYSAYSSAISYLMPKQDTPPPRPSQAQLTTRLGTVSITWDGKTSSGGAMPADLKHVQVERCANVDFTPATAVTKVDVIYPGGGLAVDAPLKVKDKWFYRLIAYDNAMNPSDAAPATPGPIEVDGVTPVDIPPLLITPGMLNGQISKSISDAGDAAGRAEDAAKGAAKIFSKATKPTLVADQMKVGDLWFDTSAGNKPYRYQAVPPPIGGFDWISIRDATLNAAFPNGDLLAANFLDKDLIRTKFLQAGLIDAKDILVEGSVTAESGVVGELSANNITTGQMHGDRITAGTISAGNIFLGDTENLIDEPRFGNPGAWTGVTPPTPEFSKQVAVTDAPSTGTGKAWQIPGNGTTRTVWNSRHFPVTPGDHLWASGYVRRLSTSITGTVSLVLLLKRKTAPLDSSTVLISHTYKTTDPVNTWEMMQTVFTTGTAPNEVITTGVVIPADVYDARFAIRIGSDVVSGNIQFAEVLLRRQSTGKLIVDGSITSDQIHSRTIEAGNIASNAITAYELDADHINVNDLKGGKITANSAIIGNLDAAKITVGVMHGSHIQANTMHADRIVALREITGAQIKANTLKADHINGRQITSAQIVGGAITAYELHSKSITSDKINGRQIKAGNIVTGAITANELAADSVSTSELKSNSIYSVHIRANEVKAVNILAGNVTASKVSSTVMDSKTITGATIRTAASGRRVQLSKSGLSLINSHGDALISLGATSSSFYIRSGTGGNRFIIDNAGIRLYAGGTNTVNLASSGSAYFKGRITAGSYFTSSTIEGGRHSGTISGGTMSGATWSGGGFSGTINNSGTVQGGTIRSNGTGTRVEMYYDSVRLVQSGNIIGMLRGHGGGSGVDLYPGNLGSAGRVYLGVQDSFVVANSNTVYSTGIYANASSGGNAVYIGSNGFLTRHTSSQRYKVKIKDLELAPEFMDVRTATWMDKPNLATMEHRVMARGTPRFTGFIAENMHKIGLPGAVVYDKMARPDTISIPGVLAHTVRYVQDLVRQVGELTERVAAMEGAR